MTESVDRFMDIADYLSQLHFDMDVTEMMRATEAPIDSGAIAGGAH